MPFRSKTCVLKFENTQKMSDESMDTSETPETNTTENFENKPNLSTLTASFI
jgi:hypothetical protein